MVASIFHALGSGLLGYAQVGGAPSTEFTGTLMLGRAMYSIAQASLSAVGGFAKSNALFKDLFLGVVLVVGLHFLYECSKVILHASHRTWMALLAPDLVRKFIRACIFMSLGLGAYGILITNAGDDYPVGWFPKTFYEAAGRPFEFFRVDPAYDAAVQAGMDEAVAAEQIPAVEELEQAVVDANSAGTDFGPAWVAILTNPANNMTPEVLLAAMNKRISDATGKLNAWSFVTGLQEQAMVDMGSAAAAKVLKEVNNGAPPVAADYSTDPKDGSGFIAKFIGGLLSMFDTTGAKILNLAVGGAVTMAYFAMDLVIVKILWMNAIYLALSYKLALIFLPVALVLGYFPSTTGLLVGIAKHIIVCVLTFRLFALAVTTMINPTFIKETISTSLPAPGDGTVPDQAYQIARNVYISLSTVNAGGGSTAAVDPAVYTAAVREYMSVSGLMDVSPGANRYTFYPLIGLMMLAFVVSLVGKLGTNIQEALNRTLT